MSEGGIERVLEKLRFYKQTHSLENKNDCALLKVLLIKSRNYDMAKKVCQCTANLIDKILKIVFFRTKCLNICNKIDVKL